jgi:hypothetical protein
VEKKPHLEDREREGEIKLRFIFGKSTARMSHGSGPMKGFGISSVIFGIRYQRVSILKVIL